MIGEKLVAWGIAGCKQYEQDILACGKDKSLCEIKNNGEFWGTISGKKVRLLSDVEFGQKRADFGGKVRIGKIGTWCFIANLAVASFSMRAASALSVVALGIAAYTIPAAMKYKEEVKICTALFIMECIHKGIIVSENSNSPGLGNIPVGTFNPDNMVEREKYANANLRTVQEQLTKNPQNPYLLAAQRA